jgi:hypothetical protein
MRRDPIMIHVQHSTVAWPSLGLEHAHKSPSPLEQSEKSPIGGNPTLLREPGCERVGRIQVAAAHPQARAASPSIAHTHAGGRTCPGAAFSAAFSASAATAAA